MDRFYRFVWEREGGYTANLDHEHADEWTNHLARRDVSATHKRNCQKSLKMLYKWLHHERGLAVWEPEVTFAADSSTQPRDYLTKDERSKIRDAALEYGSVPSYNNLTPAERDRWKRYLSQRLDKPKAAVTPDDWDRANGWKTPSLVWTSLDAGLRPTEVERATISWIDTDNSVLRIPKEKSAKNREHWVVGLRDRTAEVLSRWCQERRTYPKYDNTDAIWLTRHANTYDTASLRYLLRRLCDIAGIDTEHRQMSWYTIRHSVGTYMTREEDLAAAQAQLRHKSPETTMKYDQTPIEDRQDALDRMG
jgi:integrase